jgi:predicted permease
MIRSIENLGTHQYGFAMDDVFTARLVLPAEGCRIATSRARFLAGLQDRLASLPGARSATIASTLPAQSADRAPVVLDGVDSSRSPTVRVVRIGDHYFETFGRQLTRGREFRASDGDGAPRVAIVNASFARRLMPGRDPIGSRLRLDRDPSAPWLTVVGLASDLYMSGPENLDPAGVYVPLAQVDERVLTLAVRGAEGAALASAVRAQVAALDPDLPIFAPRTLREAVDESLWAYRVFGPWLIAAGAAALFLATLGLYSLMAFATRQRLPEIAVRMALGARPSDVARLVAGQVALQIAIGLLAGAGLGALLSSALRSMVFHVAPYDPVIYGGIVVALMFAAGASAGVPACRAMRTDPTLMLRSQ